MFEYYYASRSTPESATLVDRVREAGRAEAQAAAERLVAVGELFVLRCGESGERQDWATDTWEAVAAQVAAALQCSVAMGSSYLRYAMAMRDRLREVGKAFRAGDIDYRAFQTIVFRTDLITDTDVMARVDARLAVLLSRRPTLTRGGLAAAVDRVVAKVDRDAVRRAAKAANDRYLDVVADESGMSWVEGKVFATAGNALDRRLDELAATVCEADPRSRRQRRADALGALAAGSDRLVCGCGRADCHAAAQAPKTNVVIHVVAEQATVEGRGSTPGVLPGVEGLISAELIAELAKSARLVPLSRPPHAPEAGYTPSAKLAEFVRCRDLTCRAPGCDRPATHCDIDHTIPYAAGGATHPSNLKCLCRLHSRLREVHSRVGKIDSYPDTELRLVAALRLAARERGGPLPLIDVADALLDERLQADGRWPRYLVLSTTVALDALVCTDVTPFPPQPSTCSRRYWRRSRRWLPSGWNRYSPRGDIRTT